jgi:hypothetical protein
MSDGESITFGEIAEMFLNLPGSFQAELLAKAVRADPHVGTGVLFPTETDLARRGMSTIEFKRLVEREQAEEAMRLYRASKAKPIYPTPLELVADLLMVGDRQRPEPSVGGLLYPGRVNAVYGTHTAGKTWLSLLMAQLNADAGGQTLLIDYEDSADGIADRCLAMSPALAESVLYVAPDGPINAASLAPIIESEGITLVLLDSVGESLAMGGYDSNAERDVTQWFTEVPDAIAALGPAVLIIDHIAKKNDGTPSPVGSFRKSAAITGAQFALENRIGFSRDRDGWSRLTCTKDRNGYFATGEVVGRVDFKPHDGGMDVHLTRGAAVEQQGIASRFDAAIRDYVQEQWELQGTPDENGDPRETRPTITGIRTALRGRGIRGHNEKFAEATAGLVERGWIRREVIATGPKSSREVYVPGEPFPIYDENDEEVT